jgi:hypothetical protein
MILKYRIDWWWLAVPSKTQAHNPGGMLGSVGIGGKSIAPVGPILYAFTVPYVCPQGSVIQKPTVSVGANPQILS